MKCIKCGSDTQVVNSRPRSKTSSVWRRRSCKSCGLTFTTEESVSEAEFQTVIRHESGQERPFSFARLLISIYDSMPVKSAQNAPDDAFWLATTVAHDVQQSGSDVLTSHDLAQLTYEVLSRFEVTIGMSYGAQHGVITAVRQPRRGRPRAKRIA